MRQIAIVAAVLVLATWISSGLANETEMPTSKVDAVGREHHLLKAAGHLDAAGLDRKADEIRFEAKRASILSRLRMVDAHLSRVDRLLSEIRETNLRDVTQSEVLRRVEPILDTSASESDGYGVIQQGFQDLYEKYIAERLKMYGPGVVVKAYVKLDGGLQDSMVPRLVKVSIGIPTSQFQEAWIERRSGIPANDATRPNEDELASIGKEVIKKIKDTVVPLLSETPPGSDPFPRVVVSAYAERQQAN